MIGLSERSWTAAARQVAPGRRGFTLVELLVSITIIGILAGMTLAVLGAAQEAARADRTKATIAKLNAYVMEMYESYRTRRLPMNMAGVAAGIRLQAIRDLIRMEMPDRWDDVYDPPLVNATVRRGVPFPYMWGNVPRPGVSRGAYLRRYNLPTRTDAYGSAECLYMIVTANFPEAREHFNDTEIGDVDNDGCPEFLDGWGNPIAFCRWAPGFNDSDIQSDVYDSAANAYNAAAVATAIDNDHDPFDPQRVDIHAWRLVPLIYSAGPDGIYDINPTAVDATGNYSGHPYANVDPALVFQNYRAMGNPADLPNQSVTAPGPANGTLDHYDNIHNHRTEVK